MDNIEMSVFSRPAKYLRNIARASLILHLACTIFLVILAFNSFNSNNYSDAIAFTISAVVVGLLGFVGSLVLEVVSMRMQEKHEEMICLNNTLKNK